MTDQKIEKEAHVRSIILRQEDTSTFYPEFNKRIFHKKKAYYILGVINNSHYDIRLGDIFVSSYTRSKARNVSDNCQSDIIELNKIEIVVDKIYWYSEYIDALPRGHSGYLYILGHGIEYIKEEGFINTFPNPK